MKLSQTKLLAEWTKIGYILFVLFFAFVPMFFMVVVSFKTNDQYILNPWFFDPISEWQWGNWAIAWDTVSGYIANSIFVSFTGTAITIVIVLMAAVGGQVTGIFILRNFIEDIPKELFESAQIDGAGHFQQIWNIVIPMSASIISVACIMDFLGSWNNVILPLLLLRDDELLTIPVGLYRLDGEYVKQYGQLMAGYAISSVPLLLIFLFSMRLFVKGLSAGAVKG